MKGSIETNKAVVRRFYDEMLNDGDLEIANELLDVNIVEHNNFPGMASGREGCRRFVQTMRKGFPDLRVTVEDMVAEDDKVATRVTLEGTHRGDFLDLAPTHKKVKLQGYDFVRLANRRIVEHWGLADEWDLTQQLGSHPGEPLKR